MEKQQPKFKILMFPWIAYGHIAPYIELSTTKHFDVYICDEIETSTEDLNPELQLRGPVTRLRAKKLQGYFQCYVGKKLEDDGADFKQYKLRTILSIEELD